MPRVLPARETITDGVIHAPRRSRAHAARGPANPLTPTALTSCAYAALLCPALTSVIGNTVPDSDATRDWVARLRPCRSCRIAVEARCAGLRGMRLGAREREILIGCSKSESYAVTSPGQTRAASAANRRAAQTLTRAGLVASAAPPSGAPSRGSGPARARVSMTPLGHYVMEAFGRFIVAGKPVRWTRPKAGVPLPGVEPALLEGQVRQLIDEELRHTLDELKRVLLAAVARPVRDPELLDTLTRQLQSKAQGLRGILESVDRPGERPGRGAA